MWQPQKDRGQALPVRGFRAWAARLALVTEFHITHFQTPVSRRSKVQPLTPPCSHQSHSCCFASCPGPHLQPVSPAREPGALHQPVQARTALPEQAAKIQQMGGLTHFEHLSPLPSVHYLDTVCSTQLPEHSFFLPSLILVNKAMRATEKEQPPITFFSVLLAPSLLINRGSFPWTKGNTPVTKAKIPVTTLLLPAHRSPRKQCQGQPAALFLPLVPGHQHTHREEEVVIRPQ